MSSPSQTVLFVDDDIEFLDLIQSLVQQWRPNHWQVLTASTTAQALRLLGSHRVDLAVLDLRMPIVDGIQFLQLIHRKYPQLKKALLSSYPDDARRQNATQLGAELILTKPLGVEHYGVLFEMLDELLQARTEDGFRGVLRKIGLEDILQMECLSRHTSLLEVSAGGDRGRIYIRGGQLVHAEFGSSAGEAALNQLLALRGGEFHHSPYVEPPARSLEGSWEFLLMEAARCRDETAAASDEEGPAPETRAPAGPVAPSLVDEIVVTSAEGEILYERGSTNLHDRIAVLKILHKVAQRLGESLAFGSLERAEFPGTHSHVIARLQEHGSVLIRGKAMP
jgi:CheY-like chemotaxis protein